MRNNDSPGKESSGTGSVEPTYNCTDCEWYTTEPVFERAGAQADRHERLNGHLAVYVPESKTHTSEGH